MTMARRLKAMGQRKYQVDGDARTSGPGFKLQVHADTLDIPRRWRSPRYVFVNSMSDLFHPDVPVGFIREVFSVMASTPHTYQVLTKRSKRMASLIDRLEWPANLWMGVSVETDQYSFRADHLRHVPVSMRFLSIEPLIGAVPSLDLTDIGWVIVGGESGPGARSMDLDWVLDLRDRAAKAGADFFVKQLGSVWAHRHGLKGKGDGMHHWPSEFRIRQLPPLALSEPSLPVPAES